MTEVGFFDLAIEEYRKSNPEWFVDESSQSEVESREDEPDRLGEIVLALRALSREVVQKRGTDLALMSLVAFIGAVIGASFK